MDIIGPFSPTSISGFSYLSKFARQITEIEAMYFTKGKGEAAQNPGPVIKDL